MIIGKMAENQAQNSDDTGVFKSGNKSLGALVRASQSKLTTSQSTIEEQWQLIELLHKQQKENEQQHNQLQDDYKH